MEKYVIENEHLKVALTDYGARIISVEYKGVDVICGPEKPQDFLLDKNANFGACVGRYANRIEKASFTLDGKVYNLPANDGENCLHGGHGFANRYYTCKKEDNKIVCTYLSPDMEDGFPGALALSVTYSIEGSALKIEYNASCDKKTVCNFTNHSYFNLNGLGTVLGHILYIDADKFTPTDINNIPLDSHMSVRGTPFDFRVPESVGARIDSDNEQLVQAKGYDHNYVLNGEGFRKCARLVGDKSGIKMDVYTDLPGMQVYTANFMCDKSPLLKGGVPQRVRDAICLETQYFPNTPNRADFPSCVLMPSEEYHSVTEYVFS